MQESQKTLILSHSLRLQVPFDTTPPNDCHQAIDTFSHASVTCHKEKIWPHRTIHLTKLSQGKKSISDHIRPGLFMDLDTDALHFQTDRGRMESCGI